jgi:hypothetical protein
MKQEVMKAPSSPKAKKKIEKVMGEFKRGKLKSSSGQKVKSRGQAVAIALSEARGAMKRKYGGKGISMYDDSVLRRFGSSMEDPRKPGAFMRNVARDVENTPRYSEKEREAMKEVEQAEMTRKMQQARRRFYGRP